MNLQKYLYSANEVYICWNEKKESKGEIEFYKKRWILRLSM